MTEEKKPDFEAEMKKLEDAAKKMEEGDLPLEEALKLYTEAVERTQRLKEYIDAAKLKVETLEGK